MENVGNRRNCYFKYSKTIELINLVIGVFWQDSKVKHYEEIYKEQYIKEVRNKYRLLGEIMNSLPNKGSEVLEFLLTDINLETADEYMKHIMSFNHEEFFYIFYGKYVDKKLIKDALKSDEGIEALYNRYEYISDSYLALRFLFHNKEQFIEDFFKCVKDLDTDEFQQATSDINSQIQEERQYIDKGLREHEPLEFSQVIMGKIFKNRGPYRNFIFMPSFFTSYKAIRYFDHDQILMYSPSIREFSSKDALKALKVVSDESRFKILEILSEKGPIMGKDLAEDLGIATSTLSHHMEQLKGAGFINEERVKNSKYYSININSMDRFISYLDKKFKK